MAPVHDTVTAQHKTQSHKRMKIPHRLRAPTTEEIKLAESDPAARKRVRNQLLRLKRRDEEIAAADALPTMLFSYKRLYFYVSVIKN